MQTWRHQSRAGSSGSHQTGFPGAGAGPSASRPVLRCSPHALSDAKCACVSAARCVVQCGAPFFSCVSSCPSLLVPSSLSSFVPSLSCVPLSFFVLVSLSWGGVGSVGPLPSRPGRPRVAPLIRPPSLRVGGRLCALARWLPGRGSVLACSPGGSRARAPRGCGPGRRLVGPSVFGWGSLFLSFCRSSSWRRLCSSASQRLTCRACLD